MAIPNYKDLLDFVGLSSWQFIALVIVVLALWPLLLILWKTGGKVRVSRVVLPSFKCVYISYLGSYDDIDKIYSQSVEDFQMIFKFSNYFAIFYDDPGDQVPGAVSRAIIGVTLNQIE